MKHYREVRQVGNMLESGSVIIITSAIDDLIGAEATITIPQSLALYFVQGSVEVL